MRISKFRKKKVFWGVIFLATKTVVAIFLWEISSLDNLWPFHALSYHYYEIYLRMQRWQRWMWHRNESGLRSSSPSVFSSDNLVRPGKILFVLSSFWVLWITFSWRSGSSEGSGSTSFPWKFSLTAFTSRSGSSVGSWSIPCIKFQGSPLPFFKDNWQIVEDCTKLNFLCQNGIQVSKGLTFTSFLGTQLSCQLIPLSLSYSSYRRFNFPCFSGTTGRQNRL